MTRTRYIIVRKFDSGKEVQLNWYYSLSAARREIKNLGAVYNHYIVVELDA